jgi:CRP-like cAMP-binding protein
MLRRLRRACLESAFPGAGREVLAAAASKASVIRRGRRELVADEGRSRRIYVVAQGSLDVFKRTRDGYVRVGELGPGEVVDSGEELWRPDGELLVLARTPAKLLVLDATTYAQVASQRS